MTKTSSKLGIIVLVILLSVVPLIAACSSSDDDENITPPITSIAPSDIPIVEITIGNLTDVTGVSANGMAPINMALDDMVKYYNENNLIPGVELKIESYDGQYDPSKDIPGYEWLLERGADLVFTPVPPTPASLRARVDQDKIMLFTASGNLNDLMPPGYVFSIASIPQWEAPTLLKWIAENDPDFPAGRPAKIGGASWTDGYSASFFGEMEAYAEAHPDQYEWVEGRLTNFSFTWGPEVEALKDCDYVFPNIIMNTFVKEYRAAGYTAKMIGGDPHGAFLDMLGKEDLWDEVDGMYAVRCYTWWNEDVPLMNLAKQLLNDYHPDKAEEVVKSGVSYIAIGPIYIMLELIKETVDAVGP
ncbi:ABC transporter substrate-binding protein, partial [Chloroflexota bacterium]